MILQTATVATAPRICTRQEMADIILYTSFLLSLATIIICNDISSFSNDYSYLKSPFHASYVLFNRETQNSSCDNAMHEFASTVATFANCSASNARPITVCLRCGDAFQNATKAYNSISSSSDDFHGNCHDYLLNADRVQVLRFLYSAITNLWTSLDCDYCFNQDPENATAGYHISTDAKTFNLYINETLECMSLNSKNVTANCPPDSCAESTVCKNCTKQYAKLNSFYNDIYGRGDSLCMDLVDLMNMSRTLWSKTYLCVHRKNSVTYLFAVTTAVLLLPVAFYFAAWLQSDKQEQSVIPQKRLIQVQTRAALEQEEQH